MFSILHRKQLKVKLVVLLKGILQSVRDSHHLLNLYNILVVPSNCVQRSLINNYSIIVPETFHVGLRALPS